MTDLQPIEQINHEMDHEPEHHHHQNDNDAATNVREPPALDNIFYDCLERIFDFLDLSSLLNVAGTCKRLQIAAATKFSHDYGNKTVYLYRITCNSWLRYDPGILTPENGPIRVNGLKFCYPFLRCFGAEITRLEVDYNSVLDTQKHRLDRYINQYCADTLTRFSIRNGHVFSNESFSKPFKFVKKISASWFDLGTHLEKFVSWFPILEQLRMVRINIDDTTIAVPFPHLKRLYIYLYDNTRTDFSNGNVENLLHANPQIETLEMYFCQFRLNELLNVLRGNPLISSVVLDGEITEKNEIELERFRSERPSLVKLELQNSVDELD